MPLKSNLPTSNRRIRTRSVARAEVERTAKIAAELVINPEIQANTRARTRSGADVETPVTTAPEPIARSRTTSAPTVLNIAPHRVTRSVTAAQRSAAATKVGTTENATTTKAPGVPQPVAQHSTRHRRPRDYRTPTPPCEAHQSEPALPCTPKAVSVAKQSSTVSGHQGSTPMGPSSQSAPNDAKFGMLKRILKLELTNKVVAADEAYAKNMYAHLITDSEIKAALKKMGYASGKKYEDGRGKWVDLPDVANVEAELYGKFVKITANVLEHLGKSNAQGTRTPMDTNSTRFVHRDNSTHRSRPDISIVATGPSFEATNGVGKACYSNMASFFELKVESAQDTDSNLLHQTGVYARQMFMYQPNRKFVRTIVLTEHHVRLINFDRSGTKYSPWINIHKDPYTFVRLILGLTSYDEEVLGLDTNVQWVIDNNGRKASGTIKMVDSNNEELTFDLLDVHPVFLRAAICGRGTTCWSGLSHKRGADGKRLKVFIKDAWRSDDRTPEYTFLEEVRGVNGVSRVLRYEDRRAETKNFRGTDTSEDVGFFNRIWLRLVTEQHGQSLRHFTSQKQAIAALRDTILTHRNMIKFKQILHRDISIQNILLGLVDEDALPGLRGILIDLDMAVHTGPRSLSSVSSDHRTGTRMYQSCSVLRSYPSNAGFQEKFVLPHDYLDDLESFFFVTAHLMFGWAGVEEKAPTDLFVLWDDENPTVSQNAKSALITDDLDLDRIPPFWETPCRELLTSFHGFIHDMFEEKRKVRRVVDMEGRIQKLEKLYEDFEDHYKALKTMFDKALKELDELKKARPTQARPAPTANPNPSLVIVSNPYNPPPAPRPGKRGSGSVDESDELETPSKRSRTTVGTKSRFAEAMDAQNETVRG